MRNRELFTELSAHECKCKCGASYIGHGAKCPKCVAADAEITAAENAKSMAILEAREKAERAERRARRRTEWREAV